MVSTLSLIALIVMIAFLAYEYIQFMKEKHKKNKPTVPQFNPNDPVQGFAPSTVVSQSGPKHGISHGMLIIILAISIVVLGITTVFGMSAGVGSNLSTQQPQIVVQEVPSKGIKVYSSSWKELKGKDAASLKGGDTIIIGIETVRDADIDKARIRINKTTWSVEDSTQKFNKLYNVYYQEHVIASSDAKLKIDAQLHSLKDGWLGDYGK